MALAALMRCLPGVNVDVSVALFSIPLSCVHVGCVEAVWQTASQSCTAEASHDDALHACMLPDATHARRIACMDPTSDMDAYMS